tara:strand:- start:79 stop:1107 length:1029 start_codon:yes stop_codon:yes gene_type:complete
MGTPIRSVPFSKGLIGFEKYYLDPRLKTPSLKNRQHYVATLKKHPYDFIVHECGDVGLEEIDDALMQKYFHYRITRHGVSNNTLIREATIINRLLTWCVAERLIGTRPEFSKPKVEKKRRPTFDINEWRRITRALPKWIASSKNVAIERDRFYLRDFVLLSSNCGARVGEIRSLRWKDVRSHTYPNGNKRIILDFPKGKTGPREVVCNEGSDVFIKRIWDYRKEELGGENPSPDEPIFCSPLGEVVEERKKSFKSLLDFVGLRENNKGEIRTLYSLRHFYAHQQLRNDPPVSVYDLASNMGTSVRVIESNYGDRDNVARGQKMGRKSWDTDSDNNDKDYPFL